MREALRAVAAGLWAPVRRPKLALALWLARLVPIVLFFSLPLLGAAREEIGKNPQARGLLDAPADASGFAWAFTNDFLATRFDAAERVFWLILASWLLVAVLSGGLRGGTGVGTRGCSTMPSLHRGATMTSAVAPRPQRPAMRSAATVMATSRPTDCRS